MVMNLVSSRLSRTSVLLCLAGLLAGCQTKPEIVPSKGPRVATTVDQVKIYEKAPKKYERLGLVTATRAEGGKWDEKGDANAAFDAMLKKAAALGANGLLIDAEPGQFQRRVTAGYHGTFYQVPVRGKPGASAEGLAQAIWVHKEW
jgi:hypothetical protein